MKRKVMARGHSEPYDGQVIYIWTMARGWSVFGAIFAPDPRCDWKLSDADEERA